MKLHWAHWYNFPIREGCRFLFQELIISCSLWCPSMVLQVIWLYSSKPPISPVLSGPQAFKVHSSLWRPKHVKQIPQGALKKIGMLSLFSPFLGRSYLVRCLLLIKSSCPGPLVLQISASTVSCFWHPPAIQTMPFLLALQVRRERNQSLKQPSKSWNDEHTSHTSLLLKEKLCWLEGGVITDKLD